MSLYSVMNQILKRSTLERDGEMNKKQKKTKKLAYTDLS